MNERHTIMPLLDRPQLIDSEDSAELLTSVTFVRPSEGGNGTMILGTYPMLVPPRIYETVTLQDSLGGSYCPFVVHEVIHHLPKMGLGESGQFRAAVTCVVDQRPDPNLDPARVVGLLVAQLNSRRDHPPNSSPCNTCLCQAAIN